MEILFAANDAYVRHLGVAITSVLQSQPAATDLSIHIFHHDILPQNRARLQQLVAGRATLTFHDADRSDFADYPETLSHVSAETYFRLEAHRKLAHLDRVIYLDADLVCVDDLMPLWQVDLGDNFAAVVVDPTIDGPPPMRQFGLLDAAVPCFNAGVLLLDLAKMRSAHLERRFAAIIADHAELLHYGDQDILNIAFAGRVIWLPLKYNVQTNFYLKPETLAGFERYGAATADDFAEALKNPVIMHYTGREKPWHIGSRHPRKELYLDAEARSPWRGAPLLVDKGRRRPHPLLRALGGLVRALFGDGRPG